MENWKIGGFSVGAIILLLVLAFGVEFGGLKWAGFFGKEKANIEREIFTEGKSYQESKAQDLARYKHQYTTAKDPADKTAIAALIRDSYADFDGNKLKSKSLRTFLNTIMDGGSNL